MGIEEILNNYFQTKIRPQLNSCEIDTLRDYTTFKSSFISDHLLGRNCDPIQYKEWIMDAIIILSKSIKLSRLPISLTVYHGTNDNIFKNAINSNCIHTKTFLSTTLKKEQAEAFTFTKSGDKHVIEINLPAGYPALWLKQLSWSPQENELLLLYNQDFIVHDQTHKNIFTYTKVSPNVRN